MELQRLPEAKLTEGVSIDDYSTWRAVRFADRDEGRLREGINPAFLVELGAAGFNGTGLEGGVFQD